MNWNVYGEHKPSDNDEVVINTFTKHGKYSVNVKCNCQYDQCTNSWIILDPLYERCGNGSGRLECTNNDLWCTKEEYKEFQKEQNKAKREAKKKAKKD